MSNIRKGYPKHANSWEPLGMLNGCAQVLQQYRERHRRGVPDAAEISPPEEQETKKIKVDKGKGKEVVTRGEVKEEKVVGKSAKCKEKADVSKPIPSKGKGKPAGVKPVEKDNGKGKEMDKGKGKVGYFAQ
jgi:hypothetical protein